jgi:hypothetical protein
MSTQPVVAGATTLGALQSGPSDEHAGLPLGAMTTRASGAPEALQSTTVSEQWYQPKWQSEPLLFGTLFVSPFVPPQMPGAYTQISTNPGVLKQNVADVPPFSTRTGARLPVAIQHGV